MRNILTLHLAAVAAVMVLFANNAKADPVVYSGDATRIPVTRYVRDGAISIYDGIDNQATGSHVSDAMTWKDVTGQCGDWTLASGKANFSDTNNALYVVKNHSGYAVSAAQDNRQTSLTTVEVTMKSLSASSSNMRVLKFGTYNRGFNPLGGGYLSGAPYVGSTCGRFDWGNRTFTGTLVHRDYGTTTDLETVYADGADVTDLGKVTNIGWHQDNGTAYLGGGSTTFYVHALRTYSRQLSAEEVKINAHLDQARFGFGGNVHVLGEPLEAGTPSPAYGSTSHDPTESITLSAGNFTVFPDSVSAVDLGGGRRARCLGYKLGESTVTNAGNQVTVSYSDTMTITWCWAFDSRVTVKIGGATTDYWVAEGAAFAIPDASAVGNIVGWSGLRGTVAADCSTITVTAPCTIRPVIAAASTVRRWTGAVDASAAKAGNWLDANSETGCPVDGDTVVLDAAASDKPMTWDLDDVTLANWVQIGYTGTVTFKTGRTGKTNGSTTSKANGVLMADGTNKCVKVTGDVVFLHGVWTHTAQPTMKATDACALDGQGVYRVVFDVGGDFTFGQDALVNVDSKGISNDKLPQYGCHGGQYTGYYGCDADRAMFGRLKTIRTMGIAAYNAGGGNGEFHVGGATLLDGRFTAQSAGAQYYNGSGGGFWLVTGSLTGDGTVSVRAGVCTTAHGGGGGRVSIQITGTDEDFSEFSGKVQTQAGTGGGFVGTYYREVAADHGVGELVLLGAGAGVAADFYYNKENSDTKTVGGTFVASEDEEDSTFKRLVINRGAFPVVVTGTKLTVGEIVSIGGARQNELGLKGGTLQVPQEWTPTNLYIQAFRTWRSAAANSTVILGDGTGTWTVTNLSNQVYFDRDVAIFGNVHVLNGAAIKSFSNSYKDGLVNHCDATISGTLTVDAGGSVTVAGRGHPAKLGAGHPVVENYTARGGAHGGAAYDTAGVTTYGSVKNPITFGSGGNTSAGGGAIKIVADAIVNNGTISANGDGTKQSGAGGSIWLITGSLTGTGTITSIGGSGESEAVVSAGGGGRIALTVTNETAKISDFTGTITARGGLAKTNVGAAAGTIYLRDGDQGDNEGTLLIDGSTTAKNVVVPTEISASVTEAEVGRVVVTNGASLRVNRACTLTVHEDFESHGNGGLPLGEISDGILAGGAVEFVDVTKTSRISGENPFANFTAATPGKRLEFAAGDDSLVSIVAGGVMTVTGTESDPVLLRSTSEGDQWRISLDAAASADITYADVKDSDATPGTKIVVEDDTVNSGNNDNWGFIESIVPGALIVWTGAHGTSFTDPDNWNPARAPVATDVIRIPADCDSYPTLAAPLVANKLEIEHGASLSLDGFDLTVTNGMMNVGTVNAANGASQITLSGNVTNATFVCGNSTVTLTGTSAQFVNLGEQTYHNLVIANEVTFDSGFIALNLTAVATDARQIAFAAGKQVTATYAILNGKVGDSSVLTLKSAVPNTAWRIEVLSKAEVKGVNLSDSTAVEKTLYAELPSVDQGGNNALWVFGTSSATWTGGSAETTKTWTNDLNWADGKAPDATSRVVFNDAATVKLPDEGVTIRQLEIDSAGGTVRLNASGNATGEVGRVTIATTLDIMNGAVLSQNAPITVGADAFVRAGGKLTHPANGASDAGYGVALTVGGDFTIETDGLVSADGGGFSSGHGPGMSSSSKGSSHGGYAFYNNLTDAFAYGSTFLPVTLGSGGRNGGAGGGRIRLDVAGSLIVDGEITSDGQTVDNYSPSGGSVIIRCGTLLGSGMVTADGGWKSNICCPGAGGRIAVYQTTATSLDAFEGRIQAAGGGVVGSGNTPYVANGTVYVENAGDQSRCGTIRLWNATGTTSEGWTQLPAVNGETGHEFRDATLVIDQGAILRLTDDLEVAELEIISGGKLVLAGHILTIRSHAHRTSTPDGRGGRKGNWPGTVDYSTGDSGSTGTIRFKSSGSMFIVR